MFKRSIFALACACLLPLSAMAAPSADSPSSTDQNGVFWSADVSEAITHYLETNIAETNFGGRAFAVFQILDATRQDIPLPTGETAEVYGFDLWTFLQEYSLDEAMQTLAAGTGRSGPLRLIVRKDVDRFGVINHVVPRDGSLYANDIRALMTPLAADLILEPETQIYNQRIEALQTAMKEKLLASYALQDLPAGMTITVPPPTVEPALVDDASPIPLWQMMWRWIRSWF